MNVNKKLIFKHEIYLIVKQPDAINFECEPGCLPIGTPHIFSYAVPIKIYEKVMNCKIIIRG